MYRSSAQLQIRLLSAVYLNDAILVDVLEDMRCIHQDSNRAHGGHNKKQVQLQSVDNHRHILPVLAGLEESQTINNHSLPSIIPSPPLTWIYKSSFRRCSAINSTASVALLASGDNKIESELSLSRRHAFPPPISGPLFIFRLILQFGWCRSDNSITSILFCFAPMALMCFGSSAGDPDP